MADLHALTALEQAAAIDRGDVTSADLVAHHLERIAAYGDEVGAFVTVTADLATAAARAADAAPRERRGPLHGVPTAIKDLTMTEGVRTTFGSAAFADFVPPVDSDVVRFMRDAGLVSLGKTTTSELGNSLYSEGEVAPPARNPWNLAYTAGGSSGGSAAAVAAGLVPVAQGSDGGGSVRIPAAICGLVGYKPSRGLVSSGPVGFGAFGLPTHGTIARTVADAAALLDVLAAPAPGEPYLQPPSPPGGYLAAARGGDPGRLRIGRFTAPMLADTPVDDACLAAVDRAADLLAAQGHTVEDVPAPLTPAAWPLFETVWAVLALSPVPPDREELLLPITRYLRARGAAGRRRRADGHAVRAADPGAPRGRRDRGVRRAALPDPRGPAGRGGLVHLDRRTGGRLRPPAPLLPVLRDLQRDRPALRLRPRGDHRRRHAGRGAAHRPVRRRRPAARGGRPTGAGRRRARTPPRDVDGAVLR